MQLESNKNEAASVGLDYLKKLSSAGNFNLQTLTDSIPGGAAIYEVSDRLRPIYVNNGLCNMLGYTKEDFLFLNITDHSLLIHPEDIDLVFKAIKNALSAHSVCEVTYRVIKSGAAYIWVTMRGRQVDVVNGNPVIMAFMVDITKEKGLESDLKVRDQMFRLALEQTGICVWEYDIEQHVIFQSERNVLKYVQDAVIENVPQSLIDRGEVHSDYVSDFLEMYKKIHDGERRASCLIKARNYEGKFIWVRTTYTTVFNESGAPYKAIGLCEDMTGVMQTQSRLKLERQLRDAITSSARVVYDVDITNDSFIHIDKDEFARLGLDENVSYTDALKKITSSVVHPDYREHFMKELSRDALLKWSVRDNATDEIIEHHTEYMRNNGGGDATWCDLTFYLYKQEYSDDLYCFIYVKDIDERKKYETLLNEHAQFDSLTSLYNPKTTEEMISAILSDEEPVKEFVLAMLNIDEFKPIIALYGEEFGNKVLQEVARVIKSLFRSNDIIGRTGLDEFVVFVPSFPSKDFAYKKIAELCKHLNFFMQTPGGKSCKVFCTIGVVFGAGGVAFSELFRQAYDAVAKAKTDKLPFYFYG